MRGAVACGAAVVVRDAGIGALVIGVGGTALTAATTLLGGIIGSFQLDRWERVSLPDDARLGVTVWGALLWRSFCEFYVALFRISDDLRAMRAAMERGQAPGFTPPPQAPVGADGDRDAEPRADAS